MKCAVLLFNWKLKFMRSNKMNSTTISNASLHYNNQFQRVDVKTISSINLKSFGRIIDDIKAIIWVHHIDKSIKLSVANF